MRLHLIFTVPSNYLGSVETFLVGRVTEADVDRATLDVLSATLPDHLDGDFHSCEVTTGTIAELYAIDLDTDEHYDDPSQVGVDTDARNLTDSLLWDDLNQTIAEVARRLSTPENHVTNLHDLASATGADVNDLLNLSSDDVLPDLARMVKAAAAVTTHTVRVNARNDSYSHRTSWLLTVATDTANEGLQGRNYGTGGFLAPEAQVAAAVERYDRDIAARQARLAAAR